MPVDDELNIEINPHLDQHFLSNPAKLALLIKAASIQPADHVVEIGAGVGTVAERVPICQSLTVIEYDVNLIPHLCKRVPHAQVIQGDALLILSTVRCDVLVSNLPSKLTPALVESLPRLDFRVAVITVLSIDELVPLGDSFVLEAVTELEPDDFRPPQAARAEVVRVTRAQAPADEVSFRCLNVGRRRATTSPPLRHNFTGLPRIRSERPAFELHYPYMAQRMRSEAHVFGHHGEQAPPAPSEIAAKATGPDDEADPEPRSR